MRCPDFFRTVLAACLLALALPVGAHQVGISRGEYRVDGSSLRADITFARPEMMATVPGLDVNGDGALTDGEVASQRVHLAATIIDGFEVTSGQQRCRGELERAELTANDGLAVQLNYRCGQVPSAFHVRMSLLSSLSVGHRHLAAVNAGENAGDAATQVIFESSPEFDVAVTAPAARDDIAGSLFTLGIEHILTGFDHLMFLFGVILVGSRLRTLLVAITAFTLAHSVTLGIAALGVWAPSPSVVEPAIALSIVYVGVENWFVGDASRRWLLTFPFGLIHGFGFAGALREIALPKAQVPLALLSFNLGVETGQILVLAIVLPILLWLRRRPWFVQQGVRSASTMIAIAGMIWFVQRVA